LKVEEVPKDLNML